MSEMNEQQAAQWRKTISIGKGKYVMFYGLLAWGIGLTAIITGIEWITQQSYTPSWVYIRFIVFAVIGFFISTQRWSARERKLQTYMLKKGA